MFYRTRIRRPVWTGDGKSALTQQVDDALVVGGKQSDGVFEQEPEGRVDDAIRQLVGVDLWTTTREKQSDRRDHME